MSSDLAGDQYLEAVGHFQAERWKECLEVARLNLTNPTLSQYYTMKNLLLIAVAEDDWYPAEEARRRIVSTWNIANERSDAGNELEQEALRQIRADLDRLIEHLKANRPMDFEEDDMLYLSDDDDFDDSMGAMSETDVYGDHEASVLEAEREVFGGDDAIVATYDDAAAKARAACEERLAREEDAGMVTLVESEEEANSEAATETVAETARVRVGVTTEQQPVAYAAEERDGDNGMDSEGQGSGSPKKSEAQAKGSVSSAVWSLECQARSPEPRSRLPLTPSVLGARHPLVNRVTLRGVSVMQTVLCIGKAIQAQTQQLREAAAAANATMQALDRSKAEADRSTEMSKQAKTEADRSTEASKQAKAASEEAKRMLEEQMALNAAQAKAQKMHREWLMEGRTLLQQGVDWVNKQLARSEMAD